MRKLKNYLLVALLFITASVFSQTKITGIVVDETNQPLPGASVVVEGTSTGVSTDFDGNFTLETSESSGKVSVSFVGYETQSINYSGSANLGTIAMILSAESLDEIVIVGSGLIDLVSDRVTPIAASTITAAEIQKKIGTQDITMTLANTPSIYVAGQAGGYGDSRIAVRGFGQDNTAYLLNGQPINGMEDGKMYWSNWSGINDIASIVQIQRGLGSSKLAISSVGGTTNFVTRTTDKREGGFASVGVANDDYIKTTMAYSTGQSEKGWGTSVMLSYWQGSGYNHGTRGSGQTYFISVGYKLNEQHNFNFLVTGAPQMHDQNFSKEISDYLTYGRKYNTNYGYHNGSYKSIRTNFYHKPVINLNWDWNINDNSSFSTVLYASFGRGGGTGPRGSYQTTANGLVDWDETYAANASITNGEGGYYAAGGGFATRASMNLHKWYGLVSNFETSLNENIKWNIGLDLRNYTGTHFREIVDFHGLNSWQENVRLLDQNNNHSTLGSYGTYKSVIVTESGSRKAWYNTFNTIDEDQRIAWDYDETINYGGIFTQLEYSKNNLSAFFQGSISNQWHQRWDRYQYADDSLLDDLGGIINPDTGEAVVDGVTAEKVDNFGFNVKGGMSYVINDQHKFYTNLGYYSRQPYHDNIYLNYTNQVNPLTENEKILGLELGYGFKSRFFSANVDLYRTSWKDRVTTSSSTASDGTIEYTTNFGVEQLHQGVEFAFVLTPTEKFKVKGFASIGKWEFQGDVISREYDEDLNLLNESEDDVDGGKVGDAAQLTAGIGFDFEFLPRFSVDSDFRFYDNLFADVGAVKKNLELPSYDVIDAGISYKMLLGKNDENSLNLRINVNNVFDEIYLSESRTAIEAVQGGQTYKGINVANQVFFGYGRTFNFSMRYKF